MLEFSVLGFVNVCGSQQVLIFMGKGVTKPIALSFRVNPAKYLSPLTAMCEEMLRLCYKWVHEQCRPVICLKQPHLLKGFKSPCGSSHTIFSCETLNNIKRKPLRCWKNEVVVLVRQWGLSSCECCPVLNYELSKLSKRSYGHILFLFPKARDLLEHLTCILEQRSKDCQSSVSDLLACQVEK